MRLSMEPVGICELRYALRHARVRYPGTFPYAKGGLGMYSTAHLNVRYLRYGPRFRTEVLGTLGTDLNAILHCRYDRYVAPILASVLVYPSTIYSCIGTIPFALPEMCTPYEVLATSSARPRHQKNKVQTRHAVSPPCTQDTCHLGHTRRGPID